MLSFISCDFSDMALIGSPSEYCLIKDILIIIHGVFVVYYFALFFINHNLKY
jgi:hypothetical protein